MSQGDRSIAGDVSESLRRVILSGMNEQYDFWDDDSSKS
jgi:hypothetical protein